MALRQIDVDTPQPNGRFGEPTRSGNIKINANTAETETRLQALESGTSGTGARLDDEIAARAAADVALSAADVVLGQRIDAEQSARQAGDAAVAGRIIGKNFIINGDFRVWQRGYGLADGVGRRYLADRFFNESVGTTTSVGRFPFATNQTQVPGAPLYYHRTVVSSVAGNGNMALLCQPVEGVGTLSGRRVTLSFWAQCPDGPRKLGIELVQNYGGGGSVGVTGIGAQQITVGTAWARYSMTIDVPALAQTTVGQGDHLAVVFWMDAGTTFAARSSNIGRQSGAFHFAQVQLEEGPTATTFEWRPIATELAMCQRYYEKSYNIDVAPGTTNTTDGISQFQIGGLSSSGRTISLMTKFNVSKRAKPAVTLYSYVTGAANRVRDAMAGVDVTPGNANAGMSGFSSDVTLAANVLVNVVGHWAADAEI